MTTVYVATVDTRYEIMGVGSTREEAIRVAGERAYEWLKERDALFGRNTVEAIIEDFGIDGHVSKIKVGTAVVIGVEET